VRRFRSWAELLVVSAICLAEATFHSNNVGVRIDKEAQFERKKLYPLLCSLFHEVLESERGLLLSSHIQVVFEGTGLVRWLPCAPGGGRCVSCEQVLRSEPRLKFCKEDGGRRLMFSSARALAVNIESDMQKKFAPGPLFDNRRTCCSSISEKQS
jgi:hypothetical protein